MQKITPFSWFDDNAEEAVSFYTSIFHDSKVTMITRYNEEGAEASGRPKGTVMTMAPEPEKSRRVMKALHGMKKIDMEILKRASGRQGKS